MDRGKDGNRDANGGLAEATASRLRFDSDEEAGEVEMEVEESPDAEGEEEQAAAEVIGSDKTSADYYFDSYSHFGTRAGPARFRQDAIYFTADLDAISI
jgi:type I protein arginine methyltransferase